MVKNNIIVNTSPGSSDNNAVSFYNFNLAGSDIDVDRNIFYEGVRGGNHLNWGSTSYSVSEFNAAFGKTNFNAEPAFLRYTPGNANSSDFHLDPSDVAAINRGTPLGSIPNMGPDWPDDKDGTSRPQGLSWDIGAFEYSGDYVLDVIPPAPAHALTIVTTY